MLRPMSATSSSVALPVAGSVRLRSAAGRWVVLATVLGSGMAFLDATVVNIALPAIGRDFNAPLSSLQWTVNAYTLTLAGFLLLGGSLGDHYGRRRVFVIGVAWFAIASLLCGIAPSSGLLIGARALQGVGAALLTPGSLAIIEATFDPDDQGAAVGAWSGLGGVATAIGPLLGGWLIAAVSWRLVFFINLPLAAAVLWVSVRHVPESRDASAQGRPIDLAGAWTAALGLAGVTYALTEGQSHGWTSGAVVVTAAVGVAALAAFLGIEARSDHPLMPLDLFGSRQFSAANLVTFVVYAALAGVLFLLPIQLQQVLGYSATEAGTALIPLTVVMLLLSSRTGRLAQQIGPRVPMTVGPIAAAVGIALLARADAGASYWSDILPAMLIFGLGLSFTVAPLTSTVLASAGPAHAGVASAINNDVARVAGLLAVAVIPLAAGISGDDYLHPAQFSDGFQMAMWISAALCAAGGVLAWFTIRRLAAGDRERPITSCPLGAPPLRGAEAELPSA
jgi:EmrB/QacA subfamily drug resistance transporter